MRSALVAVVSLISFSCAQQSDSSLCTIIVANPRTGPYSDIGEQISRVLTLVEDSLEGRGGTTVRFREVDTTADPGVARAVVMRAITEHEAPIVVGSILSSDTRAFLEAVLRSGRVIVANGSSDPGIRTLNFRADGDGFFRNWPADDFEGRVMAEYLRGTGRADTLIALQADDPYARALVAAFVTRFTELGGTIIGPDTYSPGSTNYRNLIARYPHVTDGFYVVGFPTDLATIYNSIRTASAITMYSAVGVESGDFTQVAVPPVEGLFFTAPAAEPGSPAHFDFEQAFRTRYGLDPDIVASITYDALWIAVEAVEASGCDPTRARAFLHDDYEFIGASGATSFDIRGDVVSKAVAVKFYEGGKLRIAVERMEATPDSP